MTQLIVSVDNPKMLSDIRKAIGMIRGVVSVKTERAKPNAVTLAAINEAQNGKVIRCGSFENYKKMVADLDNV